MTKPEVIETLAYHIDIEINEPRDIVNTILNHISDALIREDKIQLHGFGTFKIRKYESYIGHNPKTGERTIRLIPDCMEILLKYRSGTGFFGFAISDVVQHVLPEVLTK